MALVTKIRRIERERHSLHNSTECFCTIFEIDGKRILQLDTHGSKSRKLKGKTSQVIQFDQSSAAELKALLEEMLRK